MVMIAAALQEEARVALDLAARRSRVRLPGCSLWTLSRPAAQYLLLKTGAGPHRAADALQKALASWQPRFLLNIGYAGALRPVLRTGDLVIAARVSAGAGQRALECCAAERLQAVAARKGLSARTGLVRTVDRVLCGAVEKGRLESAEGVLAVDMETFALAQTALRFGIPFGSVRAVADEAGDAIGGAGWERKLEAARHALGVFIEAYFEDLEAAGRR